MASNRKVAQAYYEAAEARDAAALLETLHPAVRLRLTEGLPGGLGGPYEGSGAMLDALRRVVEAFDIVPRPERFLAAGDDHVVVLGRYVGTARATGEPLDAAFAHVLGFREGRVVAFTQVTDSRRWADALGPRTRRGENADADDVSADE